MKKFAWTAIALSVAIGGSVAYAADHRDSEFLAMAANSAADINDVYAWTNANASKLNLVMTIQPFAAASAGFSSNVQYVFHVTSQETYGAATSEETDIICEFASDTSVQCWVGDAAYVTGDPSDEAGVESGDGKVKVFAGQRKDPFFFNLDGFKNAVSTVKAAAAGLSFDEANCPAVDAPTSGVLVGQLQHDADGVSGPTDDFATANVVALVIQVDKNLVNGGGDILGVWGSTHEKP